MPKKSPNSVDKIVGARVRLARKENGRSQEWLADKLGLTFQQVQKYEKGTNRIGASRLQQIADALEKPVAWFFGRPQGQNGESSDIVLRMVTAPGGLRLAEDFLAIKSDDARAAVAQVAQVLAHSA